MMEWDVTYWSVDYDRVVLDYFREKWLDHPDSGYCARDVVEDTPSLRSIREHRATASDIKDTPDVVKDVEHTITRLARVGLVEQVTQNPHYRYVPATIFLPEISTSPWG